MFTHLLFFILISKGRFILNLKRTTMLKKITFMLLIITVSLQEAQEKVITEIVSDDSGV